ncbi:MAG: hypothetical protein MHM6MM_009589, partial [Cercozoa sp. M6MM]
MQFDVQSVRPLKGSASFVCVENGFDGPVELRARRRQCLQLLCPRSGRVRRRFSFLSAVRHACFFDSVRWHKADGQMKQVATRTL